MQYILQPPKSIDCTIDLPASKSISNRALVINALAGGGILPENLSCCDDTDVMLAALRDMPYEIDIKAAGTAMRFTTALLSTMEGEHVITGSERMKQRPIGILVDALRQLGADITYAGTEGFPPLLIRGRQLDGGLLEMAGNVSSQYISALLLIGPMLSKGLQLRLTGSIISRPYIELTLWMMREFGADAEWSDYESIYVKPQPYCERQYFIESDWSAASYWYEFMALMDGSDDELRLTGLMDGSKQGDSQVRYLFSLLGVKSTFATKTAGVPTTVTLRHSGHCVPRLEYDFVNAPDLAQTFVVCCALKGVPFHFRGLQTLKIKETDRIEALKREMHKLGFVVRDVDGCQLVWDGERCEPHLSEGIDTYDDHRMAMAFAPAATKFPGLRINQPQVVTKSYPHFWQDLCGAGFSIVNKE